MRLGWWRDRVVTALHVPVPRGGGGVSFRLQTALLLPGSRPPRGRRLQGPRLLHGVAPAADDGVRPSAPGLLTPDNHVLFLRLALRSRHVQHTVCLKEHASFGLGYAL